MVFTAVFVLLSVALIPYFPYGALYLRLTGGVFLLLGTVLLFRYTMIEFVYTLADDTLTVRRIIGKTERPVFSLQLTEDVKLYTKKQFKKKQTTSGKSYRQNLTAATAFVVYKQGDKKLYMEFEPNLQFYMLVKQCLENAQK